MKKVLEGELLSLAHRILQMKSKDVNSLFSESRELYEKLLILKFYNDKLEMGLIQDVSKEQIENALSVAKVGLALDNTITSGRQQMPDNLAEEDYPIVVDTFKDNYESIVEQATKLDTPIDSVVVESKEIAYETPFIEEAFVSEADSADQELLQLLDEHELSLQTIQADILKAEKSQDDDQEDDLEEMVFVGEINEDEEDELSDDEEESIEKFVFEEKEVVEHHTIDPDLFENNEMDQEIKEEAILTPIEEVEPSTFTEERTTKTIEDDPFFGFNFGEVEFVRVEDVPKELALEPVEAFEKKEEVANNQPGVSQSENTNTVLNTFEGIRTETITQPKTKSLNDIYNSKIVVGLNDRIAFERYLFEGSSEDFNRVLSQLNTVGSYDEAQSFVEHLVKPEYNNWEGKDEYAERFMTIIEKRFI